MAWDTQSTYYSGQGVVLLGNRDPATGRGYGFIPVGNCSELKLGVKTAVTEHKESQTGARGIDLRLTTEVSSTLTMKLDAFNPTNLAMALRGTSTPVPASTVTAEAVRLDFGSIAPLARIAVSSVVVRRGATVLTPFVSISTPWDYLLNAEAGSIMVNDGQKGQGLQAAITTLGTACATPFAAVTTSRLTFTVAAVPAYASVGGKCSVAGLTGTDAGLVNGRAWPIVAKTATTVTVELGVTGRTVTGSASTLLTFDGDALSVDYSSSQQIVVDSLTNAATEKYLRFEGLNTADNNKAVVVEVFRFLTDPLKELSLIGDKIQEYDIEGTVLLDAAQLTGSKYFKQTILS